MLSTTVAGLFPATVRLLLHSRMNRQSIVSTDPANGRQQSNDSSKASESPSEVEAEETSSEEEASAQTVDEEETANEGDESLTEVEALEKEIEELKAERDNLNDRLLRKAAEFENYQRRMNREKRRRHEAGKRAVIETMLEVLDDFERSLDAAKELQEAQDPETAYDSLKGGVEMVFRKFQDELQSLGVEPIEAEGKPFDEQLHEAMMRQPTDEAEPGTVLQEIRKGYTMGDRVIRHSRVVVAAEPSEDDNES